MKKRFLILAGLILAVSALEAFPQAARPAAAVPGDLQKLLIPRQSAVRLVTARYDADRNLLSGFYHAVSPVRFSRLKRFDLDWAAALDKLPTAGLAPAEKADLTALTKTVRENAGRVEADAAAAAQIASLVPFGGTIAGLEEARLRMETMNARRSAVVLSGAAAEVGKVRSTLEASLNDPSRLGGLVPARGLAVRTADAVKDLRGVLRGWFGFYNDYDPLFTWWMAQPYKDTDRALEEYEAFLREKVAPAVPDVPVPPAPPVDVPAAPAPPHDEVPDLAALLAVPPDEMRGVVQSFRGALGRGGRGGGGRSSEASVRPPDMKTLAAWRDALKRIAFDKLSRDAQVDYLYMRNTLDVSLARAGRPAAPEPPVKADASGIAGRPIGREALILSLSEELIPYTPDELIILAERQYAWCEAEMKKAAGELGFGEDWRAALEKVKETAVEPGGQPDVIRDLLRQAVAFIRSRDLLTVPEVEEETLRMEMMSPQRQLVNPFFTGGAVISVSYPTSTMTTPQKLQSMRGNNPHFSHATAFHEMIPGHNMQGFMSQRFGGVQGNLGTSFWGEGWALYWEMLLYDQGFHAKPADRVGALFWRMHRCARIVFSLKFHLGEWSPQECIDYLVAKVGHERENAAGEVRRSFAGSYGPLYQAAYMLGALQIWEVKRELVDSGKMTLKRFNDAVIQGGSKPVALLRLALGGRKLSRDMSLEWKCYSALLGSGR